MDCAVITGLVLLLFSTAVSGTEGEYVLIANDVDERACKVLY